MTLTRREFVTGTAAALVGLSCKTAPRITGSFVNHGLDIGHRLRDRSSFPAPTRTERVPIVIVGAGVAGLCAAWQLDRKGFGEFVVLELEGQAGGNARWGQNEITPFPWGAHYVPVPGAKSTLVRELFRDLDVLSPSGEWNERYVCFAPQERLFIDGAWREGIEAGRLFGRVERDEFARFHEQVAEFRASGAFTIPATEHATHADLDRLSMAAWLEREGFRTQALRWEVAYACRDDYGAQPEDVSAWAGIHYFAAREPDPHGPLTWEEGNGWIVRRMLERLESRVHLKAPVHRIERRGHGVRVLAGDTDYVADAVIYTAPTFLAPYLVEDEPAPGFAYSPWVTANLVVERAPAERGVALAWDNVLYDSGSLGYVVATHQKLRSHVDRSVWTWYYALADGSPASNRQMLLDRDWSAWRDVIVSDLTPAHPDIARCVSSIDVMRLGHAMVRPTVGFRSDPMRHRFAEAGGPVFYGNSDLSGISIFEEAQYRGVRAADRAMSWVGGSSSL